MMIPLKDGLMLTCGMLFLANAAIIVQYSAAPSTNSEGGGLGVPTGHYVRGNGRATMEAHPHNTLRSSAGDITGDRPDNRMEAMHILYGGHGSHPGFLKELQASLKSVLLNAPLDMAMEIHMLLDEEAQNAISNQILENGNEPGRNLKEWKTRQPITIHTYNVESFVPRWTKVVDETFQYYPKEMDHFRHTAGAYFRMFADDILPSNVGNIVYLDSDVIIMANLQQLWNGISHFNNEATTTSSSSSSQSSSEYYFQWGRELCSGFLVINTRRLKDFWNRIQDYDMLSLKGNYTINNDIHDDDNGGFHFHGGVRKVQKTIHQKGLGDQYLIRTMHHTEPNLIGYLPNEWDVSANDGPWWKRHGTDLDTIDRVEGVGMLHFNGGGGSKESAFESHPFLVIEDENEEQDIGNHEVSHPHELEVSASSLKASSKSTTSTSASKRDKFPSTWGLAQYYYRLPWNWAKFMMESQLAGRTDDESHRIVVQHHQPRAV